MNSSCRNARIAAVLGSACGLCLYLAPATAHGFSTETAVSDGCHESITAAAIDSAGWPDGRPPPALGDLERRILDDTSFGVGAASRNPWALAMLIGNRHVDLRGHERTDFVALSTEAAKPERQREHCLRMPSHDGANGDTQAIAECRAFIMEQIEIALGSGDSVNLTVRETHEIVLDFGGPYEVALPRYAFRMGMALHAVQDGFSHMLRTEDGMRVVHVLNYTEIVDDSYDYSEPRDGLEHLSHLDRCGTDVPQHQRQRVDFAAQASADLLAAVNDPAGGRAGRLARANEVLDRWFTYEAGCTIENDYCNPEALVDFTGTCSANGTAPSGEPWWGLLPFAGLAVFLGRRRLRRGAAAAALGLLFAIGTASGAARADDVDPEEVAEAEAEGAEVVAVSGTEDDELHVVETRVVDAGDLGAPVNRGFGVRLGLAGTVFNAGGAVQLGVRVDTTDWLQLGIDAEYNPWYSFDTGSAAPGTANLYLTAIGTWGVVGPVEIRTSLHGGVSMLLWNMVGSDKYSVGPFAGITPLGVAFRVDRMIRITVDPGGLFFSVANRQGVPLVYQQMRFGVGVQLTF